MSFMPPQKDTFSQKISANVLYTVSKGQLPRKYESKCPLCPLKRTLSAKKSVQMSFIPCQKDSSRVNMRANVLYAPSKGHFQPKNQCKCPLYRVKRTASAKIREQMSFIPAQKDSFRVKMRANVFYTVSKGHL